MAKKHFRCRQTHQCSLRLAELVSRRLQAQQAATRRTQHLPEAWSADQPSTAPGNGHLRE